MLLDSGIIVLNKPTGISSNRALQVVKRILGVKKMGHLGTLDPLGTGVLLLTCNNATKLFDSYLGKTKTYLAAFKFGEETTTLDSEGEITNKNDVLATKEQLDEICKTFVGKYMQMPPAYSAKKVNGKKAYELARAGNEVILTAKEVEIFECECLYEISQNVFMFKITCGGGTYIRSLCRDIAEKFATYGTMVAIIRTRCGDFDIIQSCTIKDIKNGNYALHNV